MFQYIVWHISTDCYGTFWHFVCFLWTRFVTLDLFTKRANKSNYLDINDGHYRTKQTFIVEVGVLGVHSDENQQKVSEDLMLFMTFVDCIILCLDWALSADTEYCMVCFFRKAFFKIWHSSCIKEKCIYNSMHNSCIF